MDEFAKTLDGQMRFAHCGTLDNAVAQAAEDVQASTASEPVVLLSPACASYDQYRNFELRGDHFRDLVQALPGIRMNRTGEG
jgi:UDP-N-acetylmuramoylalanine--D-glutamate ligase